MSEQEVAKKPQSSGDEVQASIARYQAACRLQAIVRWVVLVAIVVVIGISVLVGWYKVKSFDVGELKAEARSVLESQVLPTLKDDALRLKDRLLPKLQEVALEKAKEVRPEVETVLKKELETLQKFAEATVKERVEVEHQALLADLRRQMTVMYPQMQDPEKMAAMVENLHKASVAAATNVFALRLHEHIEQLFEIKDTLDGFEPVPGTEAELLRRFGNTALKLINSKLAKLATVE